MVNRLKVARHPGTFFDFVMDRVWGSDVFDFLIPELHGELHALVLSFLAFLCHPVDGVR